MRQIGASVSALHLLPSAIGRRLAATVAVGLLLASIAGCALDDLGDAPQPADLVGSGAPGLAGRNLTGAGSLDLASLKGKPTAVVFWLASCPHCQDLMPALQGAWETARPDANIVTAGMLVPDAPTTPGFETPEAFVASTGLRLPTLEANWANEMESWALNVVPTVYVMDADHVIRDALVGPDPAAILAAIEAAGQPVSPSPAAS